MESIMTCETNSSMVPHKVYVKGDPECKHHYMSPWDKDSDTFGRVRRTMGVKYRMCVDCGFEIRADDWDKVIASGEPVRTEIQARSFV